MKGTRLQSQRRRIAQYGESFRSNSTAPCTPETTYHKRIIHNDNGNDKYNRVWTSSFGSYLTIRNNCVALSNDATISKREIWRLIPVENNLNESGYYLLRSYHGSYLRAKPDYSVDLVQHARNWEHWKIIAVVTSTSENTYGNRSETFDSYESQGVSTKTDVTTAKTFIRGMVLKSVHGSYLRANLDGHLELIDTPDLQCLWN